MNLLDCTLRDGGYINNWNFSDKFINEYIQTTLNNGIKYIELGFINNDIKYKDKIVGKCRTLDEQYLIFIKNKYPNMKLVVMGDFTNINMSILEDKVPIDIVRIVFHKKDRYDAINLCKKIKDIGYNVSANPMAITNYNKEELIEMINLVESYLIDYIYLVDSYGSLDQEGINFLINIFIKNTKIGIHLHNNMNNALSNYEYLKNNFNNNIQLVDTTLFGMGRGAGNLQTEIVILKKNNNILNNNYIDLLIFIEKNIKLIFQNCNLKWGYDIDYLLSGLFKIHPNYVNKLRESELDKIEIIKILFLLNNFDDIKKIFNIMNFNTLISYLNNN